jgi:hypothetical protein
MRQKALVLIFAALFAGNAFGSTATVYFANQVFADEYLAALANKKSNQEVWTRAAFAYLVAKKLNVPLVNETIVKEKLSGKKSVDSLKIPDLEKQILKTFQSQQQKDGWIKLQPLYKSAEGLCKDSKEEADLKTVGRWPEEKLLALLACKRPLSLLDALRQSGAAVYQSQEVQVFHALSLYENAQYAEALRILVPLQDTSPEYRLLCDFVQRIFSLTQQGKGEVALRQSL